MNKHCENCGTILYNSDLKYKLWNHEDVYWLCFDCKQLEDIEISLFNIECQEIQYEDETFLSFDDEL